MTAGPDYGDWVMQLMEGYRRSFEALERYSADFVNATYRRVLREHCQALLTFGRILRTLEPMPGAHQLHEALLAVAAEHDVFAELGLRLLENMEAALNGRALLDRDRCRNAITGMGEHLKAASEAQEAVWAAIGGRV